MATGATFENGIRTESNGFKLGSNINLSVKINIVRHQGKKRADKCSG